MPIVDSDKPTVTVIIATTCTASRKIALVRAVDSVLGQTGIDLNLAVIVNGRNVDHALFKSLKSIPSVSIHYLEQPSYPAAMRYGRSLVTTDYFSYLDDDDEYLAGALKTRVMAMTDDTKIDFVVTNGYRHVDGQDVPFLDDTDQIERLPIHTLLRRNWLASCGGLFRASTVTLDYFDADNHDYEWTYLAFQLSLNLCLKFINVPTFRINDSPNSLSKSVGWLNSEITMIDKMIALNPPSSLLPVLYELRCAALHTSSDLHRNSGEYRLAWKFHLASLKYASGWKHLAFTRKLLFPRVKQKED
jgi:glycosyltransferase involved in cell wall biosynthesis